MTEPLRPSSIRIPVEDPTTVRQRARGRIRVVGGLLSLAMLTVAARGVQLMVDPAPKTMEIATDKRWSSVKTQGERGAILDSDGGVLAKSVHHPAVFVDPKAVQEQASGRYGVPIDQMAAQLASWLDKPASEVEDVLRGHGRYVRLATGVHPEVAAEITRAGYGRRGVILENNYRRFYPQGEMAAQLLGFVDSAGYGKQGIERHFHADLAGAEVVSEHRVDRRGSVLELWRDDARDVGGLTVHTTLDRTIQRATERALEDVIARHEPVSATAVVVEVATGRVLAMATAPSFDPNDVSSLAPEDYARTRNLAVTDAVEPGSVFKPFTMAAALEGGVATPNTVLRTPSPWTLHGVRIRDDHPHEQVTLSEMVKFSSNVGAAKIAQALKEEHGLYYLPDVFAAFGFGEATGIETQGEANGQRHPRRHFGPVELATISYGQGLTATALQLGVATAAIANDGVRMRPLLVDRVTDPFGQDVRAYGPTVAQRAVSSQTARHVTRAMEMVCEEGGTGTLAAIPGYRTAGKTGTAEKAKDGGYGSARIASFVGFAPSDRPDVAMAILVDEPSVGSRYGGVVAGPAFRDVMLTALRHRGVAPDPRLRDALDADDDAVAEAPAAWTPVTVPWEGAGWRLPDLKGRSMRDALAGLQGTDLHLAVEGAGVLIDQEPAPGRVVTPGTTVRLRFH